MHCSDFSLEKAMWKINRKDILSIEKVSFPVSTRSSSLYLQRIIEHPESLSFVIKSHGSIIGYIAASPLENFSDHNPCAQDSNFGAKDSIYVASIAIKPEYRGVNNTNSIFRQVRELFKARAYSKAKFHARIANGLNRTIERYHDGKNLFKLKEGDPFHGSKRFKEPFMYMEVTL